MQVTVRQTNSLKGKEAYTLNVDSASAPELLRPPSPQGTC
jgi:hypothetical protein